MKHLKLLLGFFAFVMVCASAGAQNLRIEQAAQPNSSVNSELHPAQVKTCNTADPVFSMRMIPANLKNGESRYLEISHGYELKTPLDADNLSRFIMLLDNSVGTNYIARLSTPQTMVLNITNYDSKAVEEIKQRINSNFSKTQFRALSQADFVKLEEKHAEYIHSQENLKKNR